MWILRLTSPGHPLLLLLRRVAVAVVVAVLPLTVFPNSHRRVGGQWAAQHRQHRVHTLRVLQHQLAQLLHVQIFFVHAALPLTRLKRTYVAVLLIRLHLLLQLAQLLVVLRLCASAGGGSVTLVHVLHHREKLLVQLRARFPHVVVVLDQLPLRLTSSRRCNGRLVVLGFLR